MIKESLDALHLPALFAKGPADAARWPQRREEILTVLRREIYGFAPDAPEVYAKAFTFEEERTFAGKARYTGCRIAFNTPKGEFSYPLVLVCPKKEPVRALFLHIAFRDNIADYYCPAEEIIDNGFALATVCYNDITRDNGDFGDGLAGMYGERNDFSWGKIAMWAWGASRAIDYLKTIDALKDIPLAVIGHSRLGKTALWCGAQDTRVDYVISNDSGCSGAAVTRGKDGERIENITTVFPYWFCSNYKKYAGREDALPFDQHWLLAACAPRRVYVSSAKEDIWADPRAEFLACAAASEAYKLLGKNGLITSDMFPTEPVCLHEGDIGYHLRLGTHFLSRTDWLYFMEYIKKHG